MVTSTGDRPLATSIKEHIEDCISHYAYDDALFLAEMNHDQEASDDTLYVLADCYHRAHRLDELYYLLKGNSLSNYRLRYIFASCCFELKKNDECLRALSGTSAMNNRQRLHPTLAMSPSASFAYALLTKLYCELSSIDDALESAEKSIRLNCLRWSSIEEYIHLGGKNPSDIFAPAMRQFQPHFKDENEMEEQVVDYEPLNADDLEEDEDEVDEDDDSTTTQSTPIMISSLASKRAPAAPKKTSTSKKSAATTTTTTESRRDSLRSARLSSLRADVENEGTTPAITSKRATVPRVAKTGSKSRTIDADSRSPKRKSETKAVVPLASRNSNSVRSSSSSRGRHGRTRSSTTSVNSTTTPVYTPASTTNRVPTSGTPMSTGSNTSTQSVVDPKDLERMAAIVTRMENLTIIHHHFSHFELDKAEKKISSLHPTVQATSQVILARARCMLEKCDYAGARLLLEAHHKEFPHKVDGMEILSTALWQQQDAHALSALATRLTENSSTRAESWCAAANSFSLAKQHSQAVQCLERAIKLNPRFAYSYTLLGHELVDCDETIKAERAYRGALAVRPRDYRAWYGLAMVHHKKEQINLAIMDLEKAISINGQNAVLLCQLASLLQGKGDMDRALATVDKALEIHPLSVAAQYHKARFLYDMRRYPDCLEVLEALKTRASDEANVYFLLGRVHKRMGDTHKALLHFNWASSMDPRGESLLGDLGEPFEDDGLASSS